MSKQEDHSGGIEFVADSPKGLRILLRDSQGGQTVATPQSEHGNTLSPDGEDLSITTPSVLVKQDPDTTIGSTVPNARVSEPDVQRFVSFTILDDLPTTDVRQSDQSRG